MNANIKKIIKEALNNGYRVGLTMPYVDKTIRWIFLEKDGSLYYYDNSTGFATVHHPSIACGTGSSFESYEWPNLREQEWYERHTCRKTEVQYMKRYKSLENMFNHKSMNHSSQMRYKILEPKKGQ